MSRLAFLLLASVFCVPAAFAQTIQIFGDEVFSDWSGASVIIQDTETIRAPGLLQAFEMGERGDDPCYLKATFAEPTGPGTSRAITRTIDLCGSRGPTQRSLKSGGSYTSLATPKAVRELSMCHSQTGFKMKGLSMEIHDMRFVDDGSPRTISSYQLYVTRAHCGNGFRYGFQDDVSCPDINGQPQFATGLRAGIRNGDIISGLQLICRQVREVQPVITVVMGGNASPPSTGASPRTSPRASGRPGGGKPPRSFAGAPSGSSTTAYTTYGSPDPKGLAGEPANQLTEMGGRSNEMLYALEFGERGDDPCFMKAHWMDASRGRDDVRTRTETFDQCNGNANGVEYLGTAHSAVQSSSGRLLPIQTVAVKTNLRNGTNRKLKAVWVDYSRPRGSSASDRDSFERSNARGNYLYSRCDAGDVVVGLELHHNTVGRRQAITGIKATCKSMREP